MAIMLNARSNVYENIFFSASQPPDSSTISQIAGIAALMDNRGPAASRPLRAFGPGGRDARAPGNTSHDAWLDRRDDGASRIPGPTSVRGTYAGKSESNRRKHQ